MNTLRWGVLRPFVDSAEGSQLLASEERFLDEGSTFSGVEVSEVVLQYSIICRDIRMTRGQRRIVNQIPSE
jgi:hypothetical protein